MILIADSGGTNTSWALINNRKKYYYRSEGLHPADLHKKRNLPEELMAVKDNVNKLFFYGSGCARPTQAMKVRKFLSPVFQFAHIWIYSDLMALAHGAWGEKPGLVGVLGTGSSMTYYNGKNLYFEVMSPGKYNDPGSGTDLGMSLLKAFKNKKLSSPLNAEVNQILNHSKNAEVAQISATHFLISNLQEPELLEICKNRFKAYLDFYKPTWEKYQKPIVFGGSIAHLGRKVLDEVLKEQGIDLQCIIKDPISKLVEYYK